MLDLFHDIEVRRAISPTRVTNNDAQVSQIIDKANREELVFVIAIGTLADADATFTVLVEDGDDATLVADGAAVPNAYLHNTEALAGFQFDDDNEVRTIGYFGPKRYVRLTITPANNTGNADISAVAVLGHGRKHPLSS